MDTKSTEILIVEDSATQARLLQAILERCGFRVRMAAHGGQALEALHDSLPSLVISDIVMPEMDGYELCRSIKSDEKLKHLPVILLTSLSDMKDVLKGLECSADGFVGKPYEEQHLLARIEYVFANQKLRASRSGTDGVANTLELFFCGQSHLLTRLPKVENAIDLLLGAYETLVEKNAALTLAKDDADQASRAKSEFLSRMSHELRTPMNAVLGFAQLLEMDETDSRKSESLKQILRAGRHLLDLINEVLDISKVEAGVLSVSLEPIGLCEVLRECVDLISPLAAIRHIIVDASGVVDCGMHVQADRQRLKQVMLNLLSNAVKFNAEAGRVTLSCRQAASGRIRIEITDTGSGIAQNDLSKLFTVFERLSAERTGIEGTGLGLALSKRLVELMGGQIGVESVVGQGSVFWVEMALADNPAKDSEGIHQNVFSEAASPIEQRRTVLYIEDNLSNLKLVEMLMERRPAVKLVSAMQGGIGLVLARNLLPDLIFLDLHLPDISGPEVLARLRSDPATYQCPVVVISANATTGEIGRLRAAGARDYLSKPFEVRQFFATLDEALANGHLEKHSL